MTDARASRYRAIVMNGDVDHAMKIADVDTDTTARAMPRYGRAVTEPGRRRVYVTTAAKGTAMALMDPTTEGPVAASVGPPPAASACGVVGA